MPTLIQVQLLKKVGTGDEEALARLYAHFSPLFLSVAFHMLTDSIEAEDALQDAFVRIWKAAPQYNPKIAPPKGWLLTILRRTCIDRIRKRRPEVSIEHLSELHLQAPKPLNKGALTELLSELPDTQKLTLELAFYYGYTHPEIAQLLNRPLGTVKSDIRRALLSLRKHFNLDDR